jgi:hypothetical protein
VVWFNTGAANLRGATWNGEVALMDGTALNLFIVEFIMQNIQCCARLMSHPLELEEGKEAVQQAAYRIISKLEMYAGFRLIIIGVSFTTVLLLAMTLKHVSSQTSYLITFPLTLYAC